MSKSDCERGTRLTEWAVRWTFVKLSREVGLRGSKDSHGPRLHDLRHRLAVTTLLRWYRNGIDVERHLPELATYLGHAHITDTILVFDGNAGAAAASAAAGGTISAGIPPMSAAPTFPALLEAFFTDRLIRQRQASPHTLASYGDTFCLLLAYVQRQLRKGASHVTLPDLDTAFLGAFLDHLEHETRQQRQEPQCPSCRHPFLLPLCGLACAGTQRIGSARARHSEQALRAPAGRLPPQRRSRRLARRP
ncbi:hypothetical protein [Mesorhizobium sp.]|uniref:hypothetical protein n=1 Tax=Mesorhizobium sp. TaxID=1871066 RepID=UPI00257C7B25|nr:hypothetical protein [Mesorhizobium sp.]